MKYLRAIFLAGAVCGFGLTLHAQTVNGIKSVVHDSVVTFRDVESLTAPVADVLRRQYRGQPDAYQKKITEALNDNLEQLIERQLILHDFVAAGYAIPESIIDEAVQERIHARYGDRASLTKSLQAQGMTYEKFRQQVRDQFIVEALRSKNVSSEIMISPHKIEQYYHAHTNEYDVQEQIKLSTIVLNKPPGGDPAAVQQLADDILTKLKSGSGFGDLAKLYSQGSQRDQGGDWGWVERSVLRPELATVAFAMKPGEISDIVDTPEALYIMKIDEIKPAHVKPLSEVSDDIDRILTNSERDRLQKQYVSRLKKKTFVRYF
jgi:peptidyl-prolyl cis-trans isomerase SurA